MIISKWLEKLKDPDIRWPFVVVAALISVAVILTSGMFKERDISEYTMSQYMQSQYNVVKARVISTDDSRLSDDPYVKGMKIGVQPIRIELLRGEHRGRVFDINNTMNRALNIHLKPNMKFLCLLQEDNGEIIRIDVYGYNRDTVIYGLAIIFFAIVILVGRKKGFFSLISLAFTVIVIVYFLVPRILEGHSPVLMAIFASLIITVVTMFIVIGCNAKSISAIIGVFAGVAIAGLASIIPGNLANLSGINTNEAEEMIALADTIPINVPELLFAGIIVSALGAIMDIGMSISSTVFEIRSVNLQLSTKELFKSGMNVGRDTIGTMTNTLILAFAGSSLTVIIIIALYYLPYLRLINLNLLGLEIIQGLSGSIGLVLTIPITAICASFLASKGAGAGNNKKPAGNKSKAGSPHTQK
jgi:uncharacterized membrane protein